MSMGKSISSASFVGNDFSPVEHHVILSSLGKVTAAKFDEVFRECADSSSTRWNALSSTRWHWHMRLGANYLRLRRFFTHRLQEKSIHL